MHDLGGRRESFGPVAHTVTEPVFHEEWEGRVFGIATFVQTVFGPNFDSFRAVMEQLPPDEYRGPYYARWLSVLERMLGSYVRGRKSAPRMKVAMAALASRRVMTRPTLPRFMNVHVLPRIVGGAKRAHQTPRFRLGDTVRVRAERHDGHTRQPRYVTGHRGTIVDHRGAAVFADVHAAARTKVAEHLYTVAFEGAELWGDGAEPNAEIRIELFEPYLEHA
jgi:nitrile hydratase beta subunit